MATEGPNRFPTTRLSLVLAAGGADTQAREALADLCRIYWHPLHAYVRRRGYGEEESKDLTQGFIARLIEKNAMAEFRRERGRFRSFLLVTLKHYLANERDAARAQKRGGGAPPSPLETEPRDDLTPEKIFEKQWAMTLLNQVIERLRSESSRAGNGGQFNRLRNYLTGEDDGIRYRELARELNMTEGAVKVAIHRLRQRFKEALREEISATVTGADEIGDEIRYLMAILRT